MMISSGILEQEKEGKSRVFYQESHLLLQLWSFKLKPFLNDEAKARRGLVSMEAET